MHNELATLPGRAVVAADGITRMVVRERDDTTRWAEQFYVAAPNVVADKQRPQFESWWTHATEPMQLFAV